MFKKVVLDHSIVITGACGDIGGAFARAMYSLGANVYLMGYDEARLAEVARDCGEAPRFVVNVTDRDKVADVIELICEEYCDREYCDHDENSEHSESCGRAELDMLACFAGIAGQSVAGGRSGLYSAIMRVNYEGTENAVNAALPYLKVAKGQVVITSSMAQFLDLPFMGAYGASKAAVGKGARVLRLELYGTGVSTTVLYPNVIDTNMTTKGYVTWVGAIVRKWVPAIPLDKAMKRIVSGVLRGKRGVYLPRWMVVVPLFEPIINRTIELLLRPFIPMLRRHALQDDKTVELTTVQRN